MSESLLHSHVSTASPVETETSLLSASGLAIEVTEFATRRSRFAVLIPVLNQGAAILGQLQKMKEVGLHSDIVLCDGNSTDGSMSKQPLVQLGIRTLLVTDQAGLGTALRMGFAYSLDEGYDGVITVDGNGKDGIDAIPNFEEYLDSGFDLIQGSRFLAEGFHENTPWDRFLGIRLLLAPLMSYFAKFRYTDPTNGFKGLSRKFLLHEQVLPLRADFKRFNLQFYVNYIAPRLGLRVTEIPVRRVYPKGVPTPTKIVGLRTRLVLLTEFFGTLFGRYNVSRTNRD